ncbi:MAG TPA: hypothetical protein VKT49_22205 [Bryobacteraceae bacterium]|nr:hypothetical protein [Bryobacteraceae bacterium]
MKNPLYIGFAVGLVAVAIVIAGVFYMQRGAHIQVTGQILKVRTAPLDEHSSAVVVDFRVTNPADYPFQVNDVTVVAEGVPAGAAEGSTVSDTDADRLLAGVPLLGQRYNPTLMARVRLAPHQTKDFMVAARFEAPDAELEKRKRLILRISEVDGAVSEISEK